MQVYCCCLLSIETFPGNCDFRSLTQTPTLKTGFQYDLRGLLKHMHVDGLSNENWLSATPGLPAGTWKGPSRRTCFGRLQMHVDLLGCKCFCPVANAHWPVLFCPATSHSLYLYILSEMPTIFKWVDFEQKVLTHQVWAWNDFLPVFSATTQVLINLFKEYFSESIWLRCSRNIQPVL